MTDHEPQGEIDVHTDEGTVATMSEIKCGAKYLLVDSAANYCPKCGDRLK